MKLVHICILATVNSVSLLDRIKSRYSNVLSDEEKKTDIVKKELRNNDRPISALNNPKSTFHSNFKTKPKPNTKFGNPSPFKPAKTRKSPFSSKLSPFSSKKSTFTPTSQPKLISLIDFKPIIRHENIQNDVVSKSVSAKLFPNGSRKPRPVSSASRNTPEKTSSNFAVNRLIGKIGRSYTRMQRPETTTPMVTYFPPSKTPLNMLKEASENSRLDLSNFGRNRFQKSIAELNGFETPKFPGSNAEKFGQIKKTNSQVSKLDLIDTLMDRHKNMMNSYLNAAEIDLKPKNEETDTKKSVKDFITQLRKLKTTPAPVSENKEPVECAEGEDDCMEDPWKDPLFPFQKFTTESSWEADTEGGWMGTLWVPVYNTEINWELELEFTKPVAAAETWNFIPEYQDSIDNKTIHFSPNTWNNNVLNGTMLKVRFLLLYKRKKSDEKNEFPLPIAHFQGNKFEFSKNEEFKYGEESAVDDSEVMTPERLAKLKSSSIKNSIKDNPFANNTKRNELTSKLISRLRNFKELEDEDALTTTAQTTTTGKSLSICETAREKEVSKCDEKSRPLSFCYIPQCSTDGTSFLPDQCWDKMNMCWCVDVKGEKIMNTIRKTETFKPDACKPKKVSAQDKLTRFLNRYKSKSTTTSKPDYRKLCRSSFF